MIIVDDGPAYTIGGDVHLGERYDITDMACDCGCEDCLAIMQKHGLIE